jgi:hypothetical protein
MYFLVLLWSLVIFASFWGYGEALRSVNSENFPHKNPCRLLRLEIVTI